MSNQNDQKSFTTLIPRHLLAGAQSALMAFGPVEMESVQYCDYAFRVNRGPESVVVRQYSSGKLVIQGKPGVLLADLAATALRFGGLPKNGFPGAKAPEPTAGPESPAAAPRYPYAGIDESGKGDYFGPLVIAAVCLSEETERAMRSLGVRDSKELSDERCIKLAQSIRVACRDRYAIVEISPSRYNELYGQFRGEKQNLNNLLAWGHARALESLLRKTPCPVAISDKFGNPRYVKAKLMEKGSSIELVQEERAERYMAVAAASLLARERFLSKLKKLGDALGTTLPKGASPAVIAAAKSIVAKSGPEALAGVAKLHFKTTQSVLGASSK